MFAPKTTSVASHPSKSAAAVRAESISASVRALVAKAPWALAFDLTR